MTLLFIDCITKLIKHTLISVSHYLHFSQVLEALNVLHNVLVIQSMDSNELHFNYTNPLITISW